MKERIKNKLIIDLAYSVASADKTADDLCNLKYSDLKKGVCGWLYTNSNSLIEDNKYSTVILTEKYHMTYPAALIFLDWYRTNPEEAVSALELRM